MGLLDKIKLGVVAALVVTCSWLFVDLHLTKAALGRATKTTEAYEQIVESQDRISASEDRTASVLEETTQAVKDTPNAQILVPTDVADAWAAGIDRLYDRGSADDSAKLLHGPASATSK